jgi:hypothetical protein
VGLDVRRYNYLMRISAFRRFRRRVRQRPWVGIAASIVLHVLVFGLLVLLGTPSAPYEVKRGEPLFVELPQSDELAARGAPSAAATPAAPPTEEAASQERPAPKAPPAPPAPAVAKTPPAPKAAPAPKAPPSPPAPAAPARRAPTPTAPPPSAPEPSSVASAPAPQLSPPTPEATPAAPEPPRVAATPPTPAEPPDASPPAPVTSPPPTPAPDVRPREPAPASPEPRMAAVPPQREPTIDGLSALRRRGPGTGGAGGRGESWSGIEGEPVPLDSTDPRYNDYLDRVRRMIKEKWGYPCIKDAATGSCDY